MRILFVALFLLVTFARDLRKEFDDWKQIHSKTYIGEEHEKRFSNFVASIKRIENLNKQSHGNAQFGLNLFSDMSPEEFRATHLLPPIQPAEENREDVSPLIGVQAPSSLDWRNMGVVTAVKNQKQCGSCWAFSATETIESAWMLAKGIKNTTFAPLAPQQIVDCDDFDDGCNGGNPPTAYQYVISAGGQDTEASYPYTGQDGHCAFRPDKVEAKISSWKYACNEDDEVTLKNNVATQGPLSICVDAANWQDYTSGIMTAWQCAWINILDHCVQAVGYDLTTSNPYWLVRNSWSTQWGEKGYIRLSYGQNTCGLTNEATYVIVPK
jgi:C1A family cysteine protease